MKVCYYGILLVFMACLLPPSIHAQTIQDLTLGETWMGEDVKLDEIDGQIIAVEFWGYN